MVATPEQHEHSLEDQVTVLEGQLNTLVHQVKKERWWTYGLAAIALTSLIAVGVFGYAYLQRTKQLKHAYVENNLLKAANKIHLENTEDYTGKLGVLTETIMEQRSTIETLNTDLQKCYKKQKALIDRLDQD